MITNKPWFSSYPAGVPHHLSYDRYGSLLDLLDESFKTHQERPAYWCMGKHFSYEAIDLASKQLASYLQSLGLSKGARVAIMLPNIPQYPMALYGVLRAGFIVVSINPLYTPRELAAQLRDCGAEAILLLEHFGKTLEDAFVLEGKAIALKHAVITSIAEMLGWKGPWLDRFIRTFKRKVIPYTLPIHVHSTQFTVALELGGQRTYERPQLSYTDIALLQYTGGTTGISKGAILTHRNLIANVLQIEAWLKPIEQRKTITSWHFLCALPMYHIFALTGCGLLGMRLGARILLVPNARDLHNLIGILKEFPEINLFPGVNTLFAALLNNPKFSQLDFSQWALTIGGGMAVQRTVAQRWQDLTGTVITEGYGLSETSPVASCNTPLATEFTGSIGLPLPDTEMCIRDEEGKDLAVGEIGEIYIRGPQVMRGYWQQEAETQNVLGADGFFRTGDIGVMDEAGYFRIVDRKKDMILVAGFNVFPNEVEDVVASIPGVLECAVVGIRQGAMGEAVKLFVVREDPSVTEEQIMEICNRELTHYKRPTQIEFRESLPKNNVGKILRRVLRDESQSG
ncbi:MAG: long-chain fatty acid--CoA ligase [Burkholderiaceae bacterium]|nr:long-chain fatty acid--CoA ligase [Burkholderiaceae bacterium]